MKATFGSDRASLKDALPSGSAPLSAEFKSWSRLVVNLPVAITLAEYEALAPEEGVYYFIKG